MNINEGGNAKTKNGFEASKVEIAKFSDKQYDDFKNSIIKIVKDINKAFKDSTGEPLFQNSGVIDSFVVFSGSGNEFFKRSKEEYTKVKPRLGDIDVQIDVKKKDAVKQFLAENEGKVFGGFTYLGTQFGADFYNVFEAPKKFQPQASNIQIDFEFIKYDEKGNPNYFDVFGKNSDWADLSQGIKGFAKQQLIPAIYKAIYARPGVVFQNSKDLPSKAFKSAEVHSRTFGYNGARDKYAPVMDANGKQVEWEGKPAFREIPTSKSTFNTNLPEIFLEMFGLKPSADELIKMNSFVGILSLMKKYFDNKRIDRVYNFYYDDLSKRTEDEGVLDAIFNKFKEVFPFVQLKNEAFCWAEYVRMNTLNLWNKHEDLENETKEINEANEVAGSEENMRFIAKTIIDNIPKGNDGKPAKVWMSGGAVRDEILGKSCNDIDLLTNCDVKDVAALFDKCEIARTGNSRLARIWIDNDLFELGCLEVGDTIENNLNSRDLTCNAILKDLSDDSYYDPIGGMADIKAKRIQLTQLGLASISAGKDPAKLIRAFRFMAQLGWSFAPETAAAIKSYSKITGGKIKIKLNAALGPANWKKLVKGKYKDKAFKALEKYGFMDWARTTFPEDFTVAECKKSIAALQESLARLLKRTNKIKKSEK